MIYWGDRVAKGLITLSGFAAIGAVSLVGVFLFWVALPLFSPTQVHENKNLEPSWHRQLNHTSVKPLRMAIDEYQTMGWILFSDGSLRVFRLDTGALMEEQNPFSGKKISRLTFAEKQPKLAIGFEDGSIQFANLDFKTLFLDEDQIPETLRNLKVGDTALYEGGERSGMVSRTPEGQFRLQTLYFTLHDPIINENFSSPVLALSHSPQSDESINLISLTAEGLYFHKLENNEKTTYKIPFQTQLNHLPFKILLTDFGDQMFMAWENGQIHRFNTQNPEEGYLAEKIELELSNTSHLTNLEFLLGKTTILAGDSQGQIFSLFTTRQEGKNTRDGIHLTQSHKFRAAKSPVTALNTSLRSRVFLTGHENGSIGLYQATSKKLIKKISVASGEIFSAIISPKEDGLWMLSPKGIHNYSLDLKHPEATLGTLFRPTWYEGYPEPTYSWQSSSGTDDFEAKFGLFPIIFGTLKATFYSLIFGVPIALFGAIYTSEFLNVQYRTKIKQILEIMASLPSVVLGFLAASIFSPLVENVLPTFMTCLIIVPLSILLGSYLWQLLSLPQRIRMARFRLFFIFLALLGGSYLSTLLGSVFEQGLFGGNMRLWLDHRVGSARGGWFYLLLPLCALAGFFLSGKALQWLVKKLSPKLETFFQHHRAFFDLCKFGIALVFTTAIAFVLSSAITGVGFDPRGSVFGSYVQRNALIVGFIMGFAIIPIIYTMAEDSLSMVPNHLRTGSLGSGATPWQTAWRIVIPTATSGLFSAVMIGLGRAVGETMIVLMAAGNTPLMDWNIFNGFRTLSANIAVELPEAVKDSTHYRTLFLTGLILFLMTSVLNTLAELVRIRFRRKAAHL